MAKYNRNFGKLDESGNVEYAPIPLPVNDNTWTNSPEIHFECGYFPIQKIEQPEEKEGYYFTSYYVFENNAIVQKWEEHEIPVEEIIEVATNEEIQDAIQEGVNSIDS